MLNSHFLLLLFGSLLFQISCKELEVSKTSKELVFQRLSVNSKENPTDVETIPLLTVVGANKLLNMIRESMPEARRLSLDASLNVSVVKKLISVLLFIVLMFVYANVKKISSCSNKEKPPFRR
jgi:hypothetical protein